MYASFNYIIIELGNVLSPGMRQAITETSANFCQITHTNTLEQLKCTMKSYFFRENVFQI